MYNGVNKIFVAKLKDDISDDGVHTKFSLLRCNITKCMATLYLYIGILTYTQYTPSIIGLFCIQCQFVNAMVSISSINYVTYTGFIRFPISTNAEICQFIKINV